ncbi:MAG TPA: hypothetical protein VGH87_07995 [Polyangiaceae bacterium]
MRRRVYIPGGRQTRVEGDARIDVVATIRATACPRCDAPLDGVRRGDLESVEMAFRCAPGKRPLAFMLTCRACNEALVVIVAPDGAWFGPKESAQQVRTAARSRVRELWEKELGKDVD